MKRKARIRKNILNLGIIVLSAGSLIVILLTTQGLDQLYGLLQRMRWEWIWGAIGVMLLYYVFDAAILHSITGLLERRRKFTRSARVSMIGHFFNAVTPFASGGQPVQAVESNVMPVFSVSSAGVTQSHDQVAFLLGHVSPTRSGADRRDQPLGFSQRDGRSFNGAAHIGGRLIQTLPRGQILPLAKLFPAKADSGPQD